MKKFKSAITVFRNKYVFATVAFIFWIAFFDRNDIFTQWDRKVELEKLETSKAYYTKEISTIKKDLSELENNPIVLEKFARENFYLKRPNEDVFIVDDSTEVKNKELSQ